MSRCDEGAGGGAATADDPRLPEKEEEEEEEETFYEALASMPAPPPRGPSELDLVFFRMAADIEAWQATVFGAKDDDCFSGQQVVRWLLQNGVAASEQEALQLGNAMIKAGHFSPQSGTGGLENKKKKFYVLGPPEEPWPSAGAAESESSKSLTISQQSTRSSHSEGGVGEARSFLSVLTASMERLRIRRANGENVSQARNMTLDTGAGTLNETSVSSLVGELDGEQSKSRRSHTRSFSLDGTLQSSLPTLGVPWLGSDTLATLDDYEEGVRMICDKMRTCLELKDRVRKMRSYKKVFQGADCVKWLADQGLATSEEQAAVIAQHMVHFEHIVGVQGAADGFFKLDGLYRFALEKPERIAADTATSNKRSGIKFWATGDKKQAKAKSGLGGWVSLEEVLQDDQGVQALYRFLSSEFCEENLLFIKRVQAFKGADSAAARAEAANDIVATFLVPRAPMLLNLPDGIGPQLVERVKEGKIESDMFDGPRRHIVTMLRRDKFHRFVDQYTTSVQLASAGSV